MSQSQTWCNEESAADIRARIEAAAQVLEFSTEGLALHFPYPIDDMDPLNRVTWDMLLEGPPRRYYGGKVAWHRLGDTPNLPLMTARSYATYMLRSISPAGEYEDYADRLFYETPQAISESEWTVGAQRASKKTLLNDLFIFLAKEIMWHEAVMADTAEEVESMVPLAPLVAQRVFESFVKVMQETAPDVKTLRQEIVAEVRRGLEE